MVCINRLLVSDNHISSELTALTSIFSPQKQYLFHSLPVYCNKCALKFQHFLHLLNYSQKGYLDFKKSKYKIAKLTTDTKYLVHSGYENLQTLIQKVNNVNHCFPSPGPEGALSCRFQMFSCSNTSRCKGINNLNSPSSAEAC